MIIYFNIKNSNNDNADDRKKTNVFAQHLKITFRSVS